MPFDRQEAGTLLGFCLQMFADIQFAKYILVFGAFLMAGPALAQRLSTPPQAGRLNWTWSKGCDGDRKLDITVRSDLKVLYHGVLPICQGNRSAGDGRAEFHFPGGHTFQGNFRTRTADSIEGDIWQAGGEPDALILGISFTTGKRILLNTIHLADRRRRASSRVDKGLFVTTFPVAIR